MKGNKECPGEIIQTLLTNFRGSKVLYGHVWKRLDLAKRSVNTFPILPKYRFRDAISSSRLNISTYAITGKIS